MAFRRYNAFRGKHTAPDGSEFEVVYLGLPELRERGMLNYPRGHALRPKAGWYWLQPLDFRFRNEAHSGSGGAYKSAMAHLVKKDAS